MTRRLYFALALLWAGVLGWGTLAWWVTYGTLGAAVAHAWTTVQTDTMVMLFLADLIIFALLVIAWLLHDMRRRGVTVGRQWLWIAGFCLVGTPAVFLYLALRPHSVADRANDRTH